MLLDARLILEITPFLATIIIELLSSGAGIKFEHQFDEIFGSNSPLGPSDKEDLSNAAIHSFHFEQCMRYYDFTTIAVFIIFLSKSLDPTFNSRYTAIAGLACICVIIGLRVVTRNYFENETPTRYVNTNTAYSRSFTLRWGEVGIISANLFPLVVLLSLNLIG